MITVLYFLFIGEITYVSRALPITSNGLLPRLRFAAADRQAADCVPHSLGEARAAPKEPLRGTTNHFYLFAKPIPHVRDRLAANRVLVAVFK